MKDGPDPKNDDVSLTTRIEAHLTALGTAAQEYFAPFPENITAAQRAALQQVKAHARIGMAGHSAWLEGASYAARMAGLLTLEEYRAVQLTVEAIARGPGKPETPPVARPAP